jgi:hypothetical protein
MTKVNLTEKLGQFSDFFAPRIVATYNENEIQLVKVAGDFVSRGVTVPMASLCLGCNS